MGIAHELDTVGNQVARRQRIEHPVVPHGDPVVYGDRVEFRRKKTFLLNQGLDLLPHLVQVGVPRYKLGEGIDHRNHRLPEMLLTHPVGPP